ncbi:MAG: hypothetical protein HYY84_10360 [Deltaproteobacteria bacterium]|nr:hypothetical protein [Deltaproteobacteria bacterium]
MRSTPILLVAALAVLAGVGVAMRGLDDDPLSALPGPRADVEAFKDVARRFQIDRMVVVGFEPSELWSRDGLSRLRRATRALASTPGVARADSITELLDLDVGGQEKENATTEAQRHRARKHREEIAGEEKRSGAGADAGADAESEAGGEAVVAPLVGDIPHDSVGMAALRKRVERSLASARLLSRDRRAALIIVTLKDARGDAAERAVALVRSTARRELGAGEVHFLGLPVVAIAAQGASVVPLAVCLPLALLLAFAGLAWSARLRFAATAFVVWAFSGAVGLLTRTFVEGVPMLAVLDVVVVLPVAVGAVALAHQSARAAFVAAPVVALVAGFPFASGASWQLAASVLSAAAGAACLRVQNGVSAAPQIPAPSGTTRWVALLPDIGLAVLGMITAAILFVGEPFGAPPPSPSTSLPASHDAVRAEAWYAQRFGIRDTTFWPVRGDLRDPAVLAEVDREVNALRLGISSATGRTRVARVDAITDVVRLVAKGFGGSAALPDTRAKVETVFGLLRGQSEIANLVRRDEGDAVRSVIIVHLAERIWRLRDREQPLVGPQVAFIKGLETTARQVVLLGAIGLLMSFGVVYFRVRPLPGFGAMGVAALFFALVETGQPNLASLVGAASATGVVSLAIGFARRGAAPHVKVRPRAFFLPLVVTIPFALFGFVPVKPVAWIGIGLAAFGVLATVTALAWWRPGFARDVES